MQYCLASDRTQAQCVLPIAIFACVNIRLERDPFRLNRRTSLTTCLRKIFSENRFPLFGILRYMRPNIGAGVDGRVSGPDELPQQLNLEFAPLAVEVETAPDR